MDDAQVQVGKQPVVSSAAVTALAPTVHTPSIRKNEIVRLLAKCLQGLASLRLTVVLFALSVVIVFCGTLAQVDAGIWTVVAQYFRSFFVWIPLQIFFSRDVKIPGGFPFPGGWLLGSLLLVNLLAAHAVRFKATWKRSGIILLHAGLIVVMVSELITGLFAVEGSMLIVEGQSSNYLIHSRATELAIVPVGTEDITDVVVVPMQLLRKVKTPIKNEALPFDVEVEQYMVNSRLYKQSGFAEKLPFFVDELPEAPAGMKNLATAGLGKNGFVAEAVGETGGVEQNKEDQPAAYVRFRHKSTGQDLGTFFLPLLLEDEQQIVTVDGKKYDVRLRFKRTYKDYSIFLHEFRHDVYVGTKIPKNYSSRILLTDPSRNVERAVLISMNDPLRYGGETFYQQSFAKVRGKQATILQVVRNPAWLMPYLSCVMVGVGMIIHFGFHLSGFLGRRAAL